MAEKERKEIIEEVKDYSDRELEELKIANQERIINGNNYLAKRIDRLIRLNVFWFWLFFILGIIAIVVLAFSG